MSLFSLFGMNESRFFTQIERFARFYGHDWMEGRAIFRNTGELITPPFSSRFIPMFPDVLVLAFLPQGCGQPNAFARKATERTSVAIHLNLFGL
jgi:hypothetical protein